MSLKEKIKGDFIEAFRQKDGDKKAVLSMINSDIKNAEIEFKLRDKGLADDKVVEIIRRNIKQRKDAIDKYQQGGREELAEKEQKEMDILKVYLPAELSSEKIREVAEKVVQESNVQDMSQMGMVMGNVMKELKGQVDGNIVRKIVTELLQK
ncbi:MAG: GatB/YqeY domain-containing protein [Candidatus Moranbacteria bacterium]|nr:GatB/YqeY domain-containing protein [Candidatus Moranbacteria bacterium]